MIMIKEVCNSVEDNWHYELVPDVSRRYRGTSEWKDAIRRIEKMENEPVFFIQKGKENRDFGVGHGEVIKTIGDYNIIKGGKYKCLVNDRQAYAYEKCYYKLEDAERDINELITLDKEEN